MLAAAAAAAAQADVQNILILGGSVTMGHGVGAENSWAAQLAAALAPGGGALDKCTVARGVGASAPAEQPTVRVEVSAQSGVGTDARLCCMPEVDGLLRTGKHDLIIVETSINDQG